MKKFTSIKQAYNSIYNNNTSTINENIQPNKPLELSNILSNYIEESVNNGNIKEIQGSKMLEMVKELQAFLI